MTDINHVYLYGRLTRDAEFKTLPSGSPVCNLSMATSRKYTKNGEEVEASEYHNLVVYGKAAENLKYTRKGTALSATGRLSTRSWEKDGQKHYRTEVICERVLMLPPGVEPALPKFDENADGEPEINPEDIPF